MLFFTAGTAVNRVLLYCCLLIRRVASQRREQSTRTAADTHDRSERRCAVERCACFIQASTGIIPCVQGLQQFDLRLRTLKPIDYRQITNQHAILPYFNSSCCLAPTKKVIWYHTLVFDYSVQMGDVSSEQARKQARAEAAREFLLSREYPQEAITALYSRMSIGMASRTLWGMQLRLASSSARPLYN